MLLIRNNVYDTSPNDKVNLKKKVGYEPYVIA